MHKTCFIFWLSLIAGLFCGGVSAQDNDQPQITVVHPGLKSLTEDLLSLTELTDEEEREYGAELEAFIQDISMGMDIARPIRVDILVGDGPLNYLVWLPYPEPDEFLENLDSIGFPTFQQPGQPDLYVIDIDDGLEQGWLLMLDEPKYAALAMTTADDNATTKRQVLAAGNPAPTFVRLNELGASILATLSNSGLSVDSQAKRRESFNELRAEDLDAIKKRPAESTPEFELRKGTSSIFYNELERIYVEAASGNIWSLLDKATAQLSISFDAAGIAETSLAESVAQFGQAPDAFAGIQRLEGSVLSGRLNVPIDSLRQKSAADFLTLLTTDIQSRIESSEILQDAEKVATQNIYNDVVKVFRDGFASGNINGFVEAIHDGTAFTLVGAVSAPGSAQLTETLKQLPLARAGNTVELNFATTDDITIHKIRLAQGFVEQADQIFGVGCEFLIGVGREQFWLATGPGSAELLASKITEAGAEAEASQIALSLDAKLSPWVNRLNELAQERGMPDAVEERAAWRDDLLQLKQLSESLASEDQLSLSLVRAAEKLSGALTLNRGLLTFVGRQISRMTKENLEL
jgi:hypothetical protein